MLKQINLVKVHEEPTAIQEALVFYTSYGVTTTDYTAAERERHYAILEQAGYIERVDSYHG